MAGHGPRVTDRGAEATSAGSSLLGAAGTLDVLWSLLRNDAVELRTRGPSNSRPADGGAGDRAQVETQGKSRVPARPGDHYSRDGGRPRQARRLNPKVPRLCGLTLRTGRRGAHQVSNPLGV